MMGDDIKPDRAVDIKLLHHMLDTLQEYLDSATLLEGKKRIDDMGPSCFSAGLKGNTLLNLSLNGVVEHD